MFSQALLASLELSINQLLRLDPVAQQQLAQLAGQVLEVEISTPLQLRCYLVLHSDGLQLANQWLGAVDCRLRAPLAQLALLATARDKTPLLHHPKLDLSGNTGLLMQLAEILQQLDLDWEYLLQQLLGPVPSALLSSSIKRQWRWLQHSQHSLEQSAIDYATEEARFLVGTAEAEVRFNEIDQLTQSLDRLSARVAQLTAKDLSA